MPLESPPLRPRVEKIGEKVAAVALIIFVIGGLLFLLNRSSPLDTDFIARFFPTLLKPAGLTLLITL